MKQEKLNTVSKTHRTTSKAVVHRKTKGKEREERINGMFKVIRKVSLPKLMTEPNIPKTPIANKRKLLLKQDKYKPQKAICRI